MRKRERRSRRPRWLLLAIILVAGLMVACGGDFDDFEDDFGDTDSGDTTSNDGGGGDTAADAPQSEYAQFRNSQGIAFVFRNTTGGQVCFATGSLSTSTEWGDNLLTDPLNAGEELVEEGFAPGRYDVIATDCDSNVLDEIYGIDVQPGVTVWEIGSNATFVEEGSTDLGEDFVADPPADTGGDSGGDAGAVAGSSFRSNPNGFAFPNYGGEFPQGNLTIDEVRTMWGDQVCANIGADGNCTPTPQASQWIASMNQSMSGGHCAGFSVLALRFYNGNLSPSQFDGGASSAYEVDQNVAAMRQIAADWTLQVTNEVWNATVNGTPNQVLAAFRAHGQPVDIGIFSSEGGHSVIAYGTQDMGGGIVRMLVYDNNWPGRENYIEIDTNANTWRYSLAALNPSEDSGAWAGDASSQTLNYIPFSAYAGNIACPFCSADAGVDADRFARQMAQTNLPDKSGSYSTIVLDAQGGDLGLTDNQGRQVSVTNGVVTSQIPGAQVFRMRGQTVYFSSQSPIMRVRNLNNTTYNINVGSRGTSNGNGQGSLYGFGNGFNFSANNLNLGSDQNDNINYDPNNRSVNYQSNSDQNPVFNFGYVGADGREYFFSVSGANLGQGQSMNFGIDDESGRMRIQGDGMEGQTFSFIMVTIDEDGNSEFYANDGMPLNDDDILDLLFQEWDGEGSLLIEVDEDGDGEPDEFIEFDDEDLDDIMDGFDDDAEFLESLGNMEEWMDDEELQDFFDAAEELLDDDEFFNLLQDTVNDLDIDDEELDAWLEEAGLDDEFFEALEDFLDDDTFFEFDDDVDENLDFDDEEGFEDDDFIDEDGDGFDDDTGEPIDDEDFDDGDDDDGFDDDGDDDDFDDGDDDDDFDDGGDDDDFDDGDDDDGFDDDGGDDDDFDDGGGDDDFDDGGGDDDFDDGGGDDDFDDGGGDDDFDDGGGDDDFDDGGDDDFDD